MIYVLYLRLGCIAMARRSTPKLTRAAILHAALDLADAAGPPAAQRARRDQWRAAYPRGALRRPARSGRTGGGRPTAGAADQHARPRLRGVVDHRPVRRQPHAAGTD